MVDETLDCTGLYCPEPIFRTRIKLDQLASGEILEIKADDPAAEEDLKRLAERLGHKVVSLEKNGYNITIRIQKK